MYERSAGFASRKTNKIELFQSFFEPLFERQKQVEDISLSNHVGLRPRFIPLKGSSLRLLPQNITPLSVGFAVHKQSRRRAVPQAGELGQAQASDEQQTGSFSKN